MLKTASAALAAAVIGAPAAIAGPYVSIENNAGFAGSDFGGSATDLFVGYEGTEGSLDYFIEGGPSMTVIDGGEADTVFAGKVGLSIMATEKLKLYSELAASFDDVNSYGTKIGAKYSF